MNPNHKRINNLLRTLRPLKGYKGPASLTPFLGKAAYVVIALFLALGAASSAYAVSDTQKKITCVLENDSAWALNSSYFPSITEHYAAYFKMKPNLLDSEEECATERLDYNGKIKFCYNGWGEWISWLGGSSGYDECNGVGSKVYEMKPGESTAWYQNPGFQVVGLGDKICVQVLFAGIPITLGCQYRTPPSIIEDYNPDALCSLASSCVYAANRHTHNLLPITAVAVECVKDTLSTLFTSNVCNSGSSYMTKLQSNVRETVISLIVIYFIVIGIKQTLAGDAPSRAEVMLYLAKAILVIYFSIGFDTGEKDSFGNVVYSHGITDLYNFFIAAASDFSYMVFSATTQNGVCTFSPEDYDSGYSYLSIWDAIDCRLVFYLGGSLHYIVTKAAGAMISPFVALVIIVPAIFTGEFFFSLMMLVMSVMVISIILFIANIFIVSLFIISLLVLLAPIFVPMMLFEATKGYFNNWRSAVMGYTLQPLILMAFVSMMFVTLDELIYSDCEFESYQFSGSTIFKLKDDSQSESCESSLGYKFMQVAQGNKDVVKTVTLLFFNWNELKDPDSWKESYTDIMKILLFLILFYYFAGMIDGIAADLSGSMPLGAMLNKATSSPFETFNRAALYKFKQAGQAFSSGKKSPASTATRAAPGGGAGGKTG